MEKLSRLGNSIVTVQSPPCSAKTFILFLGMNNKSIEVYFAYPTLKSVTPTLSVSMLYYLLFANCSKDPPLLPEGKIGGRDYISNFIVHTWLDEQT